MLLIDIITKGSDKESYTPIAKVFLIEVSSAKSRQFQLYDLGEKKQLNTSVCRHPITNESPAYALKEIENREYKMFTKG